MIVQRNGKRLQENGHWMFMYQLEEFAIIDSLKKFEGHITWAVNSIMRGEVIISTVTQCNLKLEYTQIYSGWRLSSLHRTTYSQKTI
jgi:hypothetical protein